LKDKQKDLNSKVCGFYINVKEVWQDFRSYVDVMSTQQKFFQNLLMSMLFIIGVFER
jgi:hypothetical protein